MGNYIFDPRSTFLNSLFLGEDVGNQSISPELRQIIASNQTRDAVRDLTKVQVASLCGQRMSLDLQRETNAQLGETNAQLGDIATGIGQLSQDLSHNLADGFGAVSSQIGNLAEGMEQGFHQLAGGMQAGFQHVGIGLQSGFRSVVKALCYVDQRSGQRLLIGLSSLGNLLENQHGRMVNFLGQQFDYLAGAIQDASGRIIEAIEEASQQTILATHEAANRIVKAQLATGQQQFEATVAMHRDVVRQLVQINHNLKNQEANKALEHFEDGMLFLNHGDFSRARERFAKAKKFRAGHFDTHIAEGYCCRVQNDLQAAQRAFQTALPLADGDPDAESANKRRSIAALYLGRLAFDQNQYNLADQWFSKAYDWNSGLRSALVEAAASFLLDPARASQRAMGAKRIKDHFNRFRGSAYLYWYLLALTLAPLSADLALDVFRHGLEGHPRSEHRDRVAIVGLLWQLNPRTAGVMLDIAGKAFPWLAGN